MHTIQTGFNNVSAMKDDDLIDAVLSAWDVVRQENNSQKSLVTAEQFKQWEGFRDSSTASMKTAIDGYTDKKLSPDSRVIFENMAAAIKGASYKSKEQLMSEKDEPPLQSKKKRWFGILNHK